MSMWATKSNVFDGNASLGWIHSYPRAFFLWTGAPRDKNSWRGGLWIWGILLHVWFWGGRFKKWLGLVTRRLGEVKLWSWDILLHVWFWGGGLKNDLDSWQEGLDRWGLWSCDILLHVGFWGGGLENDLESWQEVLERGILLHVGFFLGGGGLENDLASNKKSWRGEAVKLRNTLACRVLGGEV